MILDSEQQRNELLALTKIAYIQGTWEQVAPTFQAIGELQVKIMQAVVILPGWTATVEKKGE